MNASLPKLSGPKTPKGKRISSRNATQHGLTAQHPLTKLEDQRLAYLLKELTKEYDPRTITEKILLERVAQITLRLERLVEVERAAFEGARRKAADGEEILESLDMPLDLKLAYSAEVLGTGADPNSPRILPPGSWELLHGKLLSELQLNEARSFEPKGIDEAKKKCPELYKRICLYCEWENCSIVDFLVMFSENPEDVITKLCGLLAAEGLHLDYEYAPPIESNPELLEQNQHVIKSISSQLLEKLRADFATSYIAYKLEEEKNVQGNSAMPNEKQMDQLIRYSTSLNNQLSKAVGELRHVIKERKETERLTNPD